MVNSKEKKISTLIQKLGDLKTAKNRFQAERRLRWFQIESEDALWSRDVQPIINEIEIVLVELWDCILKNTEWNKAGIENAIRTRRYDEIYRLDQLVQELEKIKHKMEIEAKQLSPKTPAEIGRNTTHFIRLRIWTFVKRIPRWIYVLVIFLAALLTCLYHLGWL